ncbi:hypothetical protein [Chthonobacter rhizosphaerae]|uniref:hypothetical protein n=1 Tax=Chthonobacter rhizosphaerae TaxID=2735553 RepID=UPI0015EE879B|nr:hypothetical protein [Chthonobacter rhizosphaerae]
MKSKVRAMLYSGTVLDRLTGDLITRDLGNWITVSEYGWSKELGPRQIRQILHHAGLLTPEGRHGHYRLPRYMVAKGLGKRHDRPVKGYPFDVLSPACQALLDQEWGFIYRSYLDDEGHGSAVARATTALAHYERDRKEANMTDLNGHGRVLWLVDHFPDLPQTAMADVAGIAQKNVSKYLKCRKEQRDRRRGSQSRA